MPVGFSESGSVEYYRMLQLEARSRWAYEPLSGCQGWLAPAVRGPTRMICQGIVTLAAS